ncbi:hypothetical protein TNCV_2752441 [Trichonephila clavipes]|nr:hypothetical protein TNCV_2752441 [Trichonephila clavipes]
MSGLGTEYKGRKWESGAAKRKRKEDRPVSNQVLSSGGTRAFNFVKIPISVDFEYYSQMLDVRIVPNYVSRATPVTCNQEVGNLNHLADKVVATFEKN